MSERLTEDEREALKVGLELPEPERTTATEMTVEIILTAHLDQARAETERLRAGIRVALDVEATHGFVGSTWQDNLRSLLTEGDDPARDGGQ